MSARIVLERMKKVKVRNAKMMGRKIYEVRWMRDAQNIPRPSSSRSLVNGCK